MSADDQYRLEMPLILLRALNKDAELNLVQDSFLNPCAVTSSDSFQQLIQVVAILRITLFHQVTNWHFVLRFTFTVGAEDDLW